MQSDHILEMRGIVKKYPGVTALKGVDFFVKRKKNVQNSEHFFSVLLQACTPSKKPAVRA